MAYTIITYENVVQCIQTTLGNITLNIPFDSENSDYQKVLDDIIEQGADCFDGDIPTDLLDAAEAKRLSIV